MWASWHDDQKENMTKMKNYKKKQQNKTFQKTRNKTLNIKFDPEYSWRTREDKWDNGRHEKTLLVFFFSLLLFLQLATKIRRRESVVIIRIN